ncbi:MAG TPA: DUF4276 family protein [Flavisolibacter sp.]|jgi:hypothetical protein
MMRVGVVGEYPTDIQSVVNLLNKKYRKDMDFFPLIYDVHGSNLDNPKIKHQLRREYQIEKPELVIFIRDLDGLEHETDKIKERRSYFNEFNKVIDRRGILLLNIYELEALLLADIDAINRHYKVSIVVEDCMAQPDPKGFLKRQIEKYTTGHNPALFSKLRYANVVSACRYFSSFNTELSRFFKSYSAS